MLLLPLFPDEIAPYTYSTRLYGASFRFVIRYLERTGRYYLDVFNADGEALARGVKVVCDFPLAKRGRRVPLDLVLARSLVLKNNSPPAFRDLGARVRLVVFSAEVDGLSAPTTADSPEIRSITKDDPFYYEP